VYYHHVSRISRSMFTHALEHMLENKDLSVERLWEMDDHELDVHMKGCKGYSNDIITRLNERRLFKRALYAGTGSVDQRAALSHAGNEHHLENEIADKAGVDREYVLVDIPGTLEMEEMRTSILMDGEVHNLDEVSQLVSILEQAGWDAWRIGVYTPEEHVESVGNAARKTLNVRKALRQDVLVS
jgi:HD superfamily phosphohydrolase